jgi:TolA-binding protein
MKQHLLSIIFLFSLACNVGFGQQNCMVDLSAKKGGLEDVIAQIDEKFEDKEKLKALPSLFKSCVSKQELDNIKNTYLSLKFDAPQQQTYKTIIKKVLDDNKLLCVDFVNNIRKGGTNKNYVAELDTLLKEYENLKQKNTRANTYEGTPTENNYNVLSQLKPLLSDCVTGENLKAVQDLNTQIVTENFGGLTINFRANLKEILNTNSKLFETKTIVITTVEDSTVAEQEEEVEVPKESDSNIWMYLFYIFFVISILVNSYFLYGKFFNIPNQRKESQKTVNTKKSTALTIFEKEELKGLKKTNNSLTEKNKTLQKQLDNVNDRIKTLENLSRVSEQVVETKASSVVNLSKEKPAKQGKQRNTYEKVQYFASPNEQGEFIAKNGQNEVKQGASIYKFRIKGTEAEFEFFNHGSTFQNTLNNPNRLNAVCDFINDYNPEAKEIKTEKYGKATLQGDKWKVTEKAKISYEA